MQLLPNFLDPTQRKLRALESQMARSQNYDDWLALAAEYDELSGAEDWRHNDQSSLFDYKNISKRLNNLRQLRRDKDDQGLLFALNEGIHGNMGGMGNRKLYARAKCGTKHLVEQYTDELRDALEHLSSDTLDGIDAAELMEFFQRASHCYGSSALMLSGGGTLGYFHLGVVKALIEQELLPSVLSGASAGSFVCAIVGTRTDKEFLSLFENGAIESALTMANDAVDIGVSKTSIDMDVVKDGMARLIPDLTFEEAYRKTGRAINISISPAEPKQTSRLLNHIASPNVLIRSAVLASTALPGVFSPVRLEARNAKGETQPYLPSRRWIDGSFSHDLPAKRLARMYGVNHFIVSQVMPVLSQEPVRKNGFTQIFSDAGTAASKQLIRGSLDFLQRRTKLGNNVTTALVAAGALLDQRYSGDINIFPNFGLDSLGKILKKLEADEVSELIRFGEQRTWPQLAQIHNTTRIGRKLTQILDQYEMEEAHWRRSKGSVKKPSAAKKASAPGAKRRKKPAAKRVSLASTRSGAKRKSA